MQRYRIINLRLIADLPTWLIGKEVVSLATYGPSIVQVKLENNFDKNLFSIYTGLDGTFLLFSDNLEAI